MARRNYAVPEGVTVWWNGEPVESRRDIPDDGGTFAVEIWVDRSDYTDATGGLERFPIYIPEIPLNVQSGTIQAMIDSAALAAISEGSFDDYQQLLDYFGERDL